MLLKTRNEKDININSATKYFYFVWLKKSNDYKIRTISGDEKTTVAAEYVTALLLNSFYFPLLYGWKKCGLRCPRTFFAP